MKKALFVLTVMFSLLITVTSCKEAKKESLDTNKQSTEEVVSNDVYQCPMDCEEGKTYSEAGSCPKCKMDLKLKNPDKKQMKHAENCNCVEGGECTCEEGKCICLAEVVSTSKSCGKCEPGKCEYKAEVISTTKKSYCKQGTCSCKA